MLMSGCRPRKSTKKTPPEKVSVSLQEMVKDYMKKNPEIVRIREMRDVSHQDCHDIYLKTLEDMTDYICGRNNAIKVPDGPPYEFDNHQWPLRCKSRQHLVNVIADSLKNIDVFEFEDFEDLMQEVEKHEVSYFGETSKYDFALRYGWQKGIRPERYVYVHSKPRMAAQYLVELGYLSEIKKLERKMKLEKYKELLLPGMTAHDIEHFLCVYHDEIVKL